MMENQFLFFCTNIGNEYLLKEEIRVFYPDFSLSYSRKGFLTFKNKGVQYNLETIAQLKVTFATRSGICLGKSHRDELLEFIENVCSKQGITSEKCDLHQYYIGDQLDFNYKDLFQREINKYTPINKTVLNIITLSEKEVWVGIHKVDKNTTHYPNSKYEIQLPEESPSKSFLKIAETVELFDIKFDRKSLWLDFGSAPGGSSYFLLKNGCKVWGIDPAIMPSQILDHPNYKHISLPVQDLSQEKLPDLEIDWIHVDLNLNPKQGIKEVLRLCKKYNFFLKGLIFVVQIIKIDHVKNIENFEEHFLEWGFTNIISRQVPSHKKEYVIIARR